jgi:putative peptidoglycan lipid II flippase
MQDPQVQDDAVVPTHPDPSERRRVTVPVVALILAVSSGLGLLRDLSLAALFGASSQTDAFLVAWTIPETVVPLMGDAMTYLLVPVFVAELVRSRSMMPVVRATFLPLLAVATAVAAIAASAAPLWVQLLAPGIAERELAISCFRIASLTVVFIGASGYFMAALRADHRFIIPACTGVVYNVGILGCMFALRVRLGVLGAAMGLAVGSFLMVAIQIPSFVRVASFRGLRMQINRRLLVAASVFVPIGAYALGRQAQVFVERIVGSLLTPGAISHLNYASKIAQVPALLAVTAAAVAFPLIAKAMDDPDVLRVRVHEELRRVVLLILPPIAFFQFFAEPSVQFLLQRGVFEASDTAVTASVLRLYSLGLLGQVLIVVGVLIHFSGRRRNWAPALGVLVGLGVTVLLDVALMTSMGVRGLAVGNAVGISVAALVVLKRVTHMVPLDVRDLLRLLLIAGPLAVAASACAALVSGGMSTNPAAEVGVGALVTVALFVLGAKLFRITEVEDLTRALDVRRRMAAITARRKSGHE